MNRQEPDTIKSKNDLISEVIDTLVNSLVDGNGRSDRELDELKNRIRNN